jgi:hypothetical protein
MAAGSAEAMAAPAGTIPGAEPFCFLDTDRRRGTAGAFDLQEGACLMNSSVHTADRLSADEITQLEEQVECQLSGRNHDFHLSVFDNGLVLSGRVATYFAKQLAQHLVMQATDLPIRANEILVN